MAASMRLEDATMNRTSAAEEIPGPLLRAFAPVHRMAMGVAWGVVMAVMMFLATAVLLLRGGDNVGSNLALLSQFFFGYTVTWPGAFLGSFYGFLTGFILGWGFALARNLAVYLWLVVIKTRAEMDEYSDFLDHM